MNSGGHQDLVDVADESSDSDGRESEESGTKTNSTGGSKLAPPLPKRPAREKHSLSVELPPLPPKKSELLWSMRKDTIDSASQSEHSPKHILFLTGGASPSNAPRSLGVPHVRYDCVLDSSSELKSFLQELREARFQCEQAALEALSRQHRNE